MSASTVRAALALGAVCAAAGSLVACVSIPRDVRATFAQISPGESEITHYQRKKHAPSPVGFLDSLDASAPASADGSPDAPDGGAP